MVGGALVWIYYRVQTCRASFVQWFVRMGKSLMKARRNLKKLFSNITRVASGAFGTIVQTCTASLSDAFLMDNWTYDREKR